MRDEIFMHIQREAQRQHRTIELIASENFVSSAVKEAQGSCLTNRYAEGYVGKRYYGGLEHVDAIEQLAIDRAKLLFSTDYHVNVQPHSGSQANQAVYDAFLEPGDTVLAMGLQAGGHLSHFQPMHSSGKLYNAVHYGVHRQSHFIDYNEVLRLAQIHKPKLIVAGASAHPRALDFKRFKVIADEVGAKLVVDMAHIAGLVATGQHASPFPFADAVTSTTHKTLRGPRGGLILCRQEHAKKIDSAVFPRCQGGPLVHTIGAKAVAFSEANTLEFKTYIENVVYNAHHLAEILKYEGIKLSTDGTDNHLVILDLAPLGITGKEGETILEELGITTNRNCIPFETCSPWVTSGLRLGTAAVTTRGLDKYDIEGLGIIIAKALKGEVKGIFKATVYEYLRDMCNYRPLPY